MVRVRARRAWETHSNQRLTGAGVAVFGGGFNIHAAVAQSMGPDQSLQQRLWFE
jgi:hypothetical protein